MSAYGRHLPAWLHPDQLAELLGHVREAGWEAVDVPWAGRYRANRSYEAAAVFDRLLALAREIAGPGLDLVSHQWRLLRHGDYSLQYDDRAFDGGQDGVEVLLDLSAGGSNEAEVVWALELEPPWFVAPQQPGGVSVVSREPGIFKYERHLSCRMEDREVVRLYLALA